MSTAPSGSQSSGVRGSQSSWARHLTEITTPPPVNQSWVPFGTAAIGFGVGQPRSSSAFENAWFAMAGLLSSSQHRSWLGSVAILCGVGGIAIEARNNAKKQKRATREEEQQGLKEVGQMIQPDLSNTQNAANLLQDVLRSNFDDLNIRHLIIIDWVIAILKAEDQEALHLRTLPGFPGFSLDEGTFAWLRGTFTQLGFNEGEETECEASYQSSEAAFVFAERLASVAPQREISGLDRKRIELNELARPIKDSPEITAMLESADDWGFDIVEFKKVTDGHPLFHLGWYVLQHHNLIAPFGINHTVLKNWLAVVEASYNDPEYHNSTHAADVVQCVHYMLTKGGASKFLTPFQTLGLVLSAIVHDLGHDGFNNDFHKNTLSERAIMFNDQSVQENFHLKSFCDQTLSDPTVNIFECLSSERKLDLRRIIIDLVLATDMSFHPLKQQDLQAAILADGKEPEAWKDKSKLLMGTLLHACDISNPARPIRLATHWAQSVQSEFWAQGDREKELGLHSQPQFIKGSMDTPTSQIGFINYVVLPYYRVVHELLPDLQEVIAQLENNLDYWRRNQNKGELIKRKSSFAMSFSRQKSHPLTSLMLGSANPLGRMPSVSPSPAPNLLSPANAQGASSPHGFVQAGRKTSGMNMPPWLFLFPAPPLPSHRRLPLLEPPPAIPASGRSDSDSVSELPTNILASTGRSGRSQSPMRR